MPVLVTDCTGWVRLKDGHPVIPPRVVARGQPRSCSVPIRAANLAIDGAYICEQISISIARNQCRLLVNADGSEFGLDRPKAAQSGPRRQWGFGRVHSSAGD